MSPLNNLKLPEAVFWDMDGTLVDSEPLWRIAENNLGKIFGVNVQKEVKESRTGLGLKDGAAIMQKYGIDMSINEIVDFLSNDVVSSLKNGNIIWQPGVKEMFTQISKANIPQVLVTMSSREMAEYVVASSSVFKFDFLGTAESAARPKPFPDPYLFAANSLGVNPAKCVVFEDSVPGITSAMGAGCATIAVHPTTEALSLKPFALWNHFTGHSLHSLQNIYTAYSNTLIGDKN